MDSTGATARSNPVGADQAVIYARQRVVITGVTPEIAEGRYPVKRARGEQVGVNADIFADSHDLLSARLLVRRHAKDAAWVAFPMQPLVNDRWTGSFVVHEVGQYVYTLQAWVDRFRTWRHDLEKKIQAGQDVAVDLLVGAQLVEAAAGRTEGDAAAELRRSAETLREPSDVAERVRTALGRGLLKSMLSRPDLRFATTYARQLRVVVERRRARFSSWYEMFPRSAGVQPHQHGTFKDCENRLSNIAGMGFDVLYLPPIHPIGTTNRRG
ncbi:MAG TPA: maltotransferase domain-containing protein, partial [Desulfosarcina sp.]|nr:maltotransferase domain-containing protein [Desulfosarcina sp.]